jgi:hypothetical protein
MAAELRQSVDALEILDSIPFQGVRIVDAIGIANSGVEERIPVDTSRSKSALREVALSSHSSMTAAKLAIPRARSCLEYYTSIGGPTC